MDFNFNEEQSLLLDGAERFIRESYSLEQRRHLAASDEGFSRDNWKLFAELGWLALVLPEDADGLNCSLIEVTALMTALGRGPLLEPYVSTAILSAHLIDKAGDAAMRQSVLPAIGAGEIIAAFAHDEDNGAGLGNEKLSTKAEKSDGGYRLTGRKTMALGGASADKFIISAMLDGKVALFLADRNMAGLRVTPYPLIDHSRAADISFDDMALPVEALLGAGDDNGAIISEALDRATYAYLAEAVGCMESCLEVCSDYLKTRHQFKQPLGNFQALQHIMADMFVEAQEARSMLYFLLSRMDGDADERRKAISLAKIAIGEGSFFVAAQSIQLHGGYGVTDEYVVSHYYRRLMTIKKLFGDVEHHLDQLPLAE